MTSADLADPEEVASTVRALMDGFAAPWCIAGGWALDLFLGRATRPHSDVELAVFRDDQARLHDQFAGWTLTARVDGRREQWRRGARLELPVHEIHAAAPEGRHPPLEFLLNEADGERWIFRRDPEIVLPLERAVVATAFGVSVLSPEIVLLFKAKAPRPKDEADFRSARPALADSRRAWLRSALLRFDATHAWLRALE